MKTTFLLLSLLCLPFLSARESLALTAGMNSGSDDINEEAVSDRPSRGMLRNRHNNAHVEDNERHSLNKSNPYEMLRTFMMLTPGAQRVTMHPLAAVGTPLQESSQKMLQTMGDISRKTVESFATREGVNCEEQNFSPAQTCTKTQFSFLTDINDILSVKTIISDMFKIPRPPLTRNGACTCLREELKPAASDQEISRVREKLEVSVRKELNKKLLDEFSKHIEDFHYFYWSSKEFHQQLGRRKNLNTRSMLLCSNGGAFLQSFNNHPKCQGNSLSDIEKERKISSVFESFGMNLTDSLDSNLRKIKLDILGQENFDCSQNKSSRYCHDQERYVLSKSAGRAGDIIVTRILKSPEYREKILNDPEFKDLSPVEALSKIFKSDLEGFNGSMLKILTNDVLGNDLHFIVSRSFSSQTPLNEEDQKKVFDEINLLVSTSILHHPGIERIIKDRDLFKEVSGKIGNSESVMDYLENEADFMMKYFAQNCEKLRNNVAESICSQNGELFNSLGEKDLFDLLYSSNEYDERSKKVAAILTCENPESSSPLLNNLIVNPRIQRTSDYFQEKMLKVEDRNGSRHSLSRLRENSKYADLVASLNESFGGSFVAGAPGKDSFFDNIEGFGNTKQKTLTNVSSEGEFTALTNYVSPREVSSDGNIDPISPIYSNSATATQTASASQNQSSVAEDGKASMKRELKEFLRRKANADENAEKMVDNASDDILKELAALREEMAKNQKKITELTAENERIKLESMKKRLDDLEKDRAALEPGNPEERVSSSSKSKNYLQPTLKNVGRNFAPVAGEVGGNAGGGTAGTSGVAEGAPIGDGGNSFSSSSARSGGRKPASESSNSPVVISASTAKSGAIEIRSQEVGLDLLNHLSSNGTDIQTLINLKTSGIIYRYKVLENGKEIEKEVLIEYSKLNDDVKKIIDKKIAENKDRKKEVLRLDSEIKELQRVYSYSTLQFILAEQMKQRNNPGQ